jgi:enoyl-CoA hydratase
MSEDLVQTTIEDNIAKLTLDNPPVNAMSQGMLKALDGTFDDLSSNDDVHAVVVTGAGNNAFCAGADVNEMSQMSPEDAGSSVKLGNRVFTKIAEFDHPVIAAVNNLCLGGGLELATACDMRFSSDRARFGAPETTLGLIPAWGGVLRLPRLVGVAKAKQLIYTGQMINAQEAQRIGLVNKVVPDGDEVRASMDMAKRVSVKASPLAVSKAKRIIDEGLERPIDEGSELVAETMTDLANSHDLEEGLEAFQDNRQPEFKGE